MPERVTEEELRLFQAVQVDQHIVVNSYTGWANEWQYMTVTKVTPARIYCGPHFCFRKKDGREYGSIGSFPRQAYPNIPKYREKVEAYKQAEEERRRTNVAIKAIRDLYLRDVPLERLECALAILHDEDASLLAITTAFLAADNAWRSQLAQCNVCNDWDNNLYQCDDCQRLWQEQRDQWGRLRDVVVKGDRA